ncbi:hypothetical protein BASA50_007050 [Batrachochytrium salamandrivorans]|uniref:Uncharacterized protein n=1 Tax=Batrachochytrium salamandrivorans TaxID=1357716 RepID=A0ABQ8F7Z1_9FUNG|nr:hypothetical protein BASA50_007050 [Batrachochytrium salamandrivorans]
MLNPGGLWTTMFGESTEANCNPNNGQRVLAIGDVGAGSAAPFLENGKSWSKLCAAEKNITLESVTALPDKGAILLANSTSPGTTATSSLESFCSTHFGALALDVNARPTVRALIKEVRSIVDYTGLLTSEVPSLHLTRQTSLSDLVGQMNTVFERQHTINNMQHALGSRNYLLNVFNFAKNVQLQTIINKGKQEIDQLTRTVMDLQSELQMLNFDMEEQREESVRIRLELSQTQILLDRTIAKHDHELSTHRAMIESQNVILRRLVRQRARQDLLMDISVAIASLVILQTKVVSGSINSLANSIMSPSLYRTRIRRVTHVMVYISLVLQLRSWASTIGIHSQTNSLWQSISALLWPEMLSHLDMLKMTSLASVPEVDSESLLLQWQPQITQPKK